jgi:hypothetical protein
MLIEVDRNWTPVQQEVTTSDTRMIAVIVRWVEEGGLVLINPAARRA